MQDESVRRGASARFWITTGKRNPVEQLRLWNAYQVGLRKYGSAAACLAHGVSIAAAPGTSDHEKDPATAVDIACNTRDNPLRIQLMKEAECTTPVAGEPWHAKHRSGAAVPMSKKEVKMVDKERPYITIPCPTGGYWRLKKADGGIGFFGGAPDFNTMPGRGAKVVAPLVTLTPCMRGGRVIGYWIVDEAGHLYAFGDAPYFTSYADHPDWGNPNRIIDGLVQTAGFEAGMQIRYCFTAYEVGDREYYPDTYDIGREFKKT